MSENYYNNTEPSCFGQLCKFFIGLGLFISAFPFLFWNESRLFSLSPALEETKNNLVQIQCDQVYPDNEGKPVYITGDAKTEDSLTDDLFPVTVNGFKLKRNVEMYQWVEHKKCETKKKPGGGEETITTYTYTKEWSDSPINSREFKQSEDHENPAWNIKDGCVGAKSGTLGAFTLTESIINKMNWYEPLKVEVPPMPETPATQPPVAPEAPAVEEAPAEDPFDVPSETTADSAPAEAPASTLTTEPVVPATTLTPAQTPEAIAAANGVPEGYIYYKDGFYKGDPKKLTVGDVRVSFEFIPPAVTISLISRQSGNTFTPYLSESESVELVEKGTVIPDKMLKSANNNDAVLIWAFRLVGFFIMFIGLKLITDLLIPQEDSPSVFDWIIDFSLVFIYFCLAFAFSLATIAVAWFYHEPKIGCLILITGGVVWTLIIIVKCIMVQLKRKRQQSKRKGRSR